MQAIDLYDDVSICCEDGGDGLVIDLAPGREDLPSDSGNLAYRAAVKMHETFHQSRSEKISIEVVKRIPVAAGLAGGSADAAAVINGLAALWGIENDPELLAAAAKLGADVPFCVSAQQGNFAAIGTGTGADLTPASPRRYKILLSTPDITVPTKAVYGELKPEDYAEAFTGFGNHLQAPSLRLFPGIEDVMEAHRRLPGRIVTQLSGSGPSVFSLFEPDGEISDYSTISTRYFTVLTETKI